MPEATLTLALIYLPDFLTGFMPLATIEDELVSDSVSANRSLAFTVTVAAASTIGLTPVILDLNPGKGSISAVSTSHSFEVPERLLLYNLKQ